MSRTKADRVSGGGPAIEKTARGYDIVVGDYRTEVHLGDEAGGTRLVSIRTYKGDKRCASVVGNLLADGKIAAISELNTDEGVSPKEGLAAISQLMRAGEHVLSSEGVETIRGITHPEFAKFLEKHGYSATPRGVSVDVEKNIINSKFPAIKSLK